MKRAIVIAMVIAVAASSLIPVAEAAKKKKKKKKKPVPVEQVFHLVWGGEACAISVSTDAANPEEACVDIFWGATGSQFGSGPALAPAIDGVPLTLDASKPITGKLTVESWYFAGLGPDVMGIGQAQIAIGLTGTSGGEDVVVGEILTDPYVVTPASADYEVEFEMPVNEELAGKVLDSLTLSLEAKGNQMFHGVFPADGSSTLTIGTFVLK